VDEPPDLLDGGAEVSAGEEGVFAHGFTGIGEALGAGSVKMNPSRATNSPEREGIGFCNIGPSRAESFPEDQDRRIRGRGMPQHIQGWDLGRMAIA